MKTTTRHLHTVERRGRPRERVGVEAALLRIRTDARAFVEAFEEAIGRLVTRHELPSVHMRPLENLSADLATRAARRRA